MMHDARAASSNGREVEVPGSIACVHEVMFRLSMLLQQKSRYSLKVRSPRNRAFPKSIANGPPATQNRLSGRLRLGPTINLVIHSSRAMLLRPEYDTSAPLC